MEQYAAKYFSPWGGVDETFLAIEDIELGYRLASAGYSVRLCKEAQVKHLKRWTFGTLLVSDVFVRAIPWTEIIWRDRRFVNDLNLRLESRLSVILVYLLLVTLWAAFWLPALWVGVALWMGLLLGLNYPLYNFYKQKRGLAFMLACIPMHWLYYLYSGFSFVVGTGLYFYNKILRRPVSCGKS